MILKNDELLQEFYEREKENHPDLSIDNIKEIVFSPWQQARHIMEEGNLDKIRLKYFGVFQVHKGRAKFQLGELKGRLERGMINEKQYKYLYKILTKFLENED